MSFSGSERDEKLVPNMSDDLSDKSLRIFYCRELGCANELSAVFCGKDSLLEVDQTIEHCRGPPELNQICQQDSRAYVTTTENSCDFERGGEDPYFSTSECTDQNPCNWSDGTQTPPDNTDAVYGLIGVCGILAVLLICFFIFRCLKKKCKNNNRRSGRKQNETNGIPMRRKQVGNGNNGNISEPEDDLEAEFIPPAPSSGA